jgi:hypothetical protein
MFFLMHQSLTKYMGYVVGEGTLCLARPLMINGISRSTTAVYIHEALK